MTMLAALLLALPGCGDEARLEVSAGNAESVVPPPSCGEVACYLAVKSEQPDVDFQQVAATLGSQASAERSPTSLLAIKNALKIFHIDATGIKGDIAEMLQADCDLIVHLRLDQDVQHFSYCKIRNRQIVLYDPIFGAGDTPTSVSPGQLRQMASGNMLKLTFMKRGAE